MQLAVATHARLDCALEARLLHAAQGVDIDAVFAGGWFLGLHLAGRHEDRRTLVRLAFSRGVCRAGLGGRRLILSRLLGLLRRRARRSFQVLAPRWVWRPVGRPPFPLRCSSR